MGTLPHLDTDRAVARTSGLTTFLVLAFGISWTSWGIAALATGGPVGELALVAGTFGPALAAVAVLAREGGWPRVRHGLGGRCGRRW